jgi:hypothetical protein
MPLARETTRQWLVTDKASIEHTYEPGALIIREGEVGDSIFEIRSGSAEAVLFARALHSGPGGDALCPWPSRAMGGPATGTGPRKPASTRT